MTAPVIPTIDRDPEEGGTHAAAPSSHAPSPGIKCLARLLWTSLFYPFAPRAAGRHWLHASLWQVAVVAALHVLLGFAWLLVIAFSFQVFSDGGFHITLRIPYEHTEWRPEGFFRTWNSFVPGLARSFRELTIYDKIAGVASLFLTIVAFILVPFFVLLPFAARPGQNKPAVRHVARTVLLGFGMVHLWGLALSAAFWFRILFPGETALGVLRVITPILLTVTAMGLWTWIALARIARLDYRRDADLPQPHDPWCDDCGYNLIAADVSGRCPECGRPVLDSIGNHTRQPTPWESRPFLTNLRVILSQAKQLFRAPRSLFFSMPTLTGQRAAQRWLIFSLALVALAALPIVPAMAKVRDAEWSFDIVSGALAMAFTWAVLSCMMVGIETAGIATFSRMKGHPVFLATAAKVTCYSSLLLVVWVFFGGLQLVGFMIWGEQLLLFPLRSGSIRMHQIILAAALALPHMAGLIWYELTVYRGIRGVQYANK